MYPPRDLQIATVRGCGADYKPSGPNPPRRVGDLGTAMLTESECRLSTGSGWTRPCCSSREMPWLSGRPIRAPRSLPTRGIRQVGQGPDRVICRSRTATRYTAERYEVTRPATRSRGYPPTSATAGTRSSSTVLQYLSSSRSRSAAPPKRPPSVGGRSVRVDVSCRYLDPGYRRASRI